MRFVRFLLRPPLHRRLPPPCHPLRTDHHHRSASCISYEKAKRRRRRRQRLTAGLSFSRTMSTTTIHPPLFCPLSSSLAKKNLSSSITMQRRCLSSSPGGADVARQELYGIGVDVDVEAFHRDGVGLVKGFASPKECRDMRARMEELIQQWNPDDEITSFRTDQKQEDAQGSSDRFLDSADRCEFFMEPWAVDPATGGLRADVTKASAINKAGHGLHYKDCDAVFSAYAHSKKVAALARALGWVDPVLPQSMYIFKQPHRGGEVTSHQDSSFLHTTPRLSCLGLWLALEPATRENGCVWGRPGSHREPLRRVFRRNPKHFGTEEKREGFVGGKEKGGGKGGDPSQPQMIFEDLVANNNNNSNSLDDVPWEGGMPYAHKDGRVGKYEGDNNTNNNKGEGEEDEDDEKEGHIGSRRMRELESGALAAGFVPIECEEGDLVLIHGEVDHLSLPNASPTSRHTFQLHLIEGPSQGVHWSAGNWLQLPAARSGFPRLTV